MDALNLTDSTAEPEPLRQRSHLPLALGLVAAAAAGVLAFVPEPRAQACTDCRTRVAASREVVAVVRGSEASVPPMAEAYRSIRAAEADGNAPPIPPSETWPAQ